ncbi:hypothetical protein NBRC116494_28840 [Aurantivibrio plasticivorans]
MTVREYLDKKLLKQAIWGYSIWLVFPICLISISLDSIVFGIVGSIAVMLVSAYAGSKMVSCPKCGEEFEFMAFRKRKSYFTPKKELNFCPYCGLDFNEEYKF